MPSGFLSRLTFLNIFIIVIATAVSGWAIYNTACFLVASAGDLDAQRQQQFNRTLFHYLWVFMITAALAGSVLHFYMTKRLIRPIRNLLQSTKELKLGQYPEPIKVNNDDEMGQLVSQYNELISQLKSNEQQRKKLITDLSHEIRTPLSNLSGYLQALKDGDLTGNEKLFSDLYLESNRLSKLVEQLEQLKDWDDLSSQSFVNKDWHEIHDLMRQCVAMFDRTWEQTHYDIQLDVEPCQLPIHIEGIQQVFSNFLHNAIRYYEGTGPIVITGHKLGDHYYMSFFGPSKPIPIEEKENVFRRFYRLESSRSRMTGGSGLGLAISKEIVERHHSGQIGIVPSETGNTFWIMLPLK